MEGTTTVATKPRTAMTTNASMRVNPRFAADARLII